MRYCSSPPLPSCSPPGGVCYRKSTWTISLRGCESFAVFDTFPPGLFFLFYLLLCFMGPSRSGLSWGRGPFVAEIGWAAGHRRKEASAQRPLLWGPLLILLYPRVHLDSSPMRMSGPPGIRSSKRRRASLSNAPPMVPADYCVLIGAPVTDLSGTARRFGTASSAAKASLCDERPLL